MNAIKEVLHSVQQMVNEHKHAYPPAWHKDATEIIEQAAAELAAKDTVIEAARKAVNLRGVAHGAWVMEEIEKALVKLDKVQS